MSTALQRTNLEQVLTSGPLLTLLRAMGGKRLDHLHTPLTLGAIAAMSAQQMSERGMGGAAGDTLIDAVVTLVDAFTA